MANSISTGVASAGRVEAQRIAEATYRALVELISDAGPISRMGWKLGAAGIAVTILDGLAAVTTLVNSNGQGHAYSIARGMIEALLDLAILCGDPQHVRSLTLASQTGTRTSIQEILDAGTLVQGENKTALIGALREVVRQINAIEMDGVVALNIGEKFDRGAKEYRVLQVYYSRWNAHVHNNFEAILNRHLKNGVLQFGDTLSDGDVRELLSVATFVAIEVAHYAPKFSSVTKEHADALVAKLKVLASPLQGNSSENPSIPGDNSVTPPTNVVQIGEYSANCDPMIETDGKITARLQITDAAGKLVGGLDFPTMHICQTAEEAVRVAHQWALTWWEKHKA